ncbi:ATP-binding cassette domain-containing protein [bacterium]|nr:ATP-binding cassette domain-containing protein [bacterium]
MLELKSISKNFKNKTILDQLSLELPREKTVFVLGRSGVGKSVLLKIIVGLILQDSGEVWVNGERTTPDDDNRMVHFRKQCGLVFQMPALLDSMTIQENLQFGLEKNGAEEFATGLDWVRLSKSVLQKYPSELSFGAQKKVSVLRTLLRAPEFILFDEPTTGLDPVATEVTNKMIRNVVRERKTGCLVVSHDVKSALELADTILLLDAGKVVFKGGPGEFLKSELPLVRAFCAGTVTHA